MWPAMSSDYAGGYLRGPPARVAGRSSSNESHRTSTTTAPLVAEPFGYQAPPTPSAKSMFPRVAWLYGEILSWVSSTRARASAVGRFAHDWHLRVPAVPHRHCRLGREHPCWAVRKPFSHAMHGRRSTDPALRSIPRERSCNHAASLAACGYGSTHFALSVATDAPNRRRRPRLPAISKAELPDTRQRVD